MGTPHYGTAVDYLNSVLAQRGPQAVPYEEAVKWNIRDHISELQKVFPTLQAKLSEFHNNDGRLQHVLKAEGTLPIHYQGVKYNIPILIWLTERYPYSAPQVYVVPTQTMVVKTGHAYVDPSGQVSTPLLRAWLFPSSNLVDVALEMAHVFGNDPPLYSRPAGYTPPPQPTHAPTVQPPPAYPTTSYGSQYPQLNPGSNGPTPYATPSPAATPSSSTGSLYQDAINPAAIWGGMFGAHSSSSQPPPPPAQQPPNNPYGGFMTPPPKPDPPKPVITKEELEGPFRELAVEALSRQLRAAEQSYQQHVAGETNRALETQRKLSDKRGQLYAMRDSLTKERMGTEHVVAELANKTAALRRWLERNEAKAQAYDPDKVPASALIVPVDKAAEQALNCQAEDTAVEDTLIALDRALQAGVVSMDAYLKQVRALSRKQFYARALANKLATLAQVQAPAPRPTVPGPPARSDGSRRMQPYPAPPTDPWANHMDVSNPLAYAGASGR